MVWPSLGQKDPQRPASTICCGQTWARKSHRDSAVRFVTAKHGPERATKTWQHDLLRPRVGQKKPPRLGSTICYGQELARKSHQDSAVRFVTAKRGPERATKTRQYDLLRPNVGQKEPPRLGSTICYGQTWARKSHRDSAVLFVTATRLARKSHQDSAVRFVTAKRVPERATKTRQYDLLRPTERATETRQYDVLLPDVGQKEPPRLGSPICYGQACHRDSAARFVTAKSWPERATETRQYALLRPRVGQKEPPRLGSTICYGQTWARKSHQDSAVRFVTAKSWPENATETQQYDLLRPNVGQKEPPRLGFVTAKCWPEKVLFVTATRLARKSHQDSAVRFVTAKRVPERATKTRQYDLLRPRVGQKEPPRLGSTICYGQTWARKSHQASAARFVTAKRGPERATETRQYDLLLPTERATETRQYDLLLPNVGQKEPPRLGSPICYGQELARISHQDSAVRFVTAKRGPEKATKTRQYDLLRPNVGQKESRRLGSTICYGQTWARNSHQDSAVRFVTAGKSPRLGSPICYGQTWARRLGSTICYGQTWARKSQQDSAVRFVTAKSWPERATETRQYDLLRPNVGQKEPPRLGSTICCGQELARKSYQDSAVRFVTAKSWPERATKTRQYDLLRPNVGQKEPPRFGSTICYGQTWARKSHQDSAVRFVTAKRGPERATRLGSTICHGQELARKSHGDSAVRFVTAKSWPERATKTRQYDLLRPNVGQKEPQRLGSTICYGQELARKSHRTICYGQTWARKSHQDSAVRFVAAKRGPERAAKTRQYDLLRPRVGQKEPPRLGSAICYGQEFGQKEPPRHGSTICCGQTCARKSQQDSAVRFVTAKSWPERVTKTRQYELLRPRVGQKEPPRLGSTICYGPELARKSHQDSAVRFVTAKRWPERATKTRQYDLLRPRVGQKEPPRLGSTICYGQELFVTAKRGPERATKTRQYDLLRPRVVQKEPPRLGSTICYGQELARRSHEDSAVRFVTAKSWPKNDTKTRQYDFLRPNVFHRDSAVRFVTAKRGPERATKIRQYDLLWPRDGQDKPPRLGSTICYGQTWARKSHQDSAVRFVTAKRGPQRAIKTRQHDLLRPRLGQKKPPSLGSTICYGQELARKSHRDSAVRFVTAKRGPERATKTRQYDLLRPNVGQKEPPRLGSTICCGQTWARKSHQDSAVRFVTAKTWSERATKTRQYDLLRPRVGQKEPRRLGSAICYGQEFGQKEPPRLGSTICYGQTCARKSHQDSAIRFVTAKNWPERATKTRQYDLLRPRVGQKEPPRLGSTICYGTTWARKSHQDSAVRFVTAKSWPEGAMKTRQYDLLRPRVGQKMTPRLGSTICYGQELARKSH